MARFTSLFAIELLALFLPLYTTAGLGAEALTLNILSFNTGGEVKFQMLPTRRVGAARIEGDIRPEGRQLWIKVKYENLRPAVYFGGDVSCYVLWAVNAQGVPQSLGELWVRSDKDRGEAEFYTGLGQFALLITAESFPEVSSPSSLVMFWNHPATVPLVSNLEFFFQGFVEPPASAVDSLDKTTPKSIDAPDVIQAQRVLAIADGLNASQYAPQPYTRARNAFDQAEYEQGRGKKNEARDFARSSVAYSNEAIQLAKRRIEMEQLENEIQKRQQKTEELEARAGKAEELLEQIAADRQVALANLQEASNQLEQAGAQLENIRVERDHLQDQTIALREERAGLQNRLQTALSQVADTRESARGFIVNLPDILFDVGKATLKQDAKLVLAKLAGILLLMPDLNLRIEGHTDSTGSASLNMKLSEERATSVFDLLSQVGISPDRITTAGYGMQKPVADNSTGAGRQKNRRVELIIAEGSIAEQ
jgi:outer membrane protein OmpA-like peptidoglycan-associated protein